MPTLIAVVDPESKWFNYAITDSALFHGTMLHSAAHNALLSGNTDLADPALMKWEATRLINQRLGDPILSISDVTMGAVVCLVLFEVSFSPFSLCMETDECIEPIWQCRAIQHSYEWTSPDGQSPRRHPESRPSRNPQEKDPVVCVFPLPLPQYIKLADVVRADLCNATLTNSQPQFDLYPELKPNRNRLANTHFLPRTRSTAIDVSSRPWRCSCDKARVEILHSLRNLSNTVSNEQRPKMLIVDEIYLVERRLVVLLASDPPTRHSPSCHSVNQPIFIACLIYIYAFLRDFPVRSPLFGNLVQRLTAGLFGQTEEGGFNSWSGDMYPTLLWVLVIGALVSEGRCERDRFVLELKRVCEVEGVVGLEDFEAGLRNSAWLTRKALESTIRATPFLRTLWDEVQSFGVGSQLDVAMMGTMDLIGGF